MRVTNGMITNTTLNGLYNNMSALNKTYAQMATGKKIQTVSDDPIIAARSLKLTTNVLEINQYQSNVKEANSWGEVSASSLTKIMDILKNDIRSKCVQGANGTLKPEDKQSIRTQIEQLWKQIQTESNNTYAGRYVFCGYKTNEPMVLTREYEVEGTDMTAQGKITVGSNSNIAEDSVLKEGSTLSKGTVLGKGSQSVKEFTLGTGSLVSEDDAKDLLGFNYSAATSKCSFDSNMTIASGTELTKAEADELNTIMAADATWTPLAADENGKYILESDVAITAGTEVSNDFSKSLLGAGVQTEGSKTQVVTTKAFRDLEPGGYTFKEDITLGAGSSFSSDIQTKGNTVLAEHSAIAAESTLKVGTTFGVGTLNPKVIGHIDGQNIEYEIGTNSTISVNAQGLDSAMLDIAECLNEIFVKMDEAMEDETVSNEELNLMFTRKLEEIDDILANVGEISTDLASRQKRLTYVSSRLTDQNLTFKELLSETEDIDIEEVYTKFNVQYATYQSALQATSKIITNTLADYI